MDYFTNLFSKIGNGLDEDLKKEINKVVHNQLSNLDVIYLEGLKSEFKQELKVDIEKNILPELKTSCLDNLKKTTKQELLPEIIKEIKNTASAELNEIFKNEFFNELTEEIKERFFSELKISLKKEILEELKSSCFLNDEKKSIINSEEIQEEETQEEVIQEEDIQEEDTQTRITIRDRSNQLRFKDRISFALEEDGVQNKLKLYCSYNFSSSIVSKEDLFNFLDLKNLDKNIRVFVVKINDTVIGKFERNFNGKYVITILKNKFLVTSNHLNIYFLANNSDEFRINHKSLLLENDLQNSFWELVNENQWKNIQIPNQKSFVLVQSNIGNSLEMLKLGEHNYKLRPYIGSVNSGITPITNHDYILHDNHTIINFLKVGERNRIGVARKISIIRNTISNLILCRANNLQTVQTTSVTNKKWRTYYNDKGDVNSNGSWQNLSVDTILPLGNLEFNYIIDGNGYLFDVFNIGDWNINVYYENNYPIVEFTNSNFNVEIRKNHNLDFERIEGNRIVVDRDFFSEETINIRLTKGAITKKGIDFEIISPFSNRAFITHNNSIIAKNSISINEINGYNVKYLSDNKRNTFINFSHPNYSGLRLRRKFEESADLINYKKYIQDFLNLEHSRHNGKVILQIIDENDDSIEPSFEFSKYLYDLKIEVDYKDDTFDVVCEDIFNKQVVFENENLSDKMFIISLDDNPALIDQFDVLYENGRYKLITNQEIDLNNISYFLIQPKNTSAIKPTLLSLLPKENNFVSREQRILRIKNRFLTNKDSISSCINKYLSLKLSNPEIDLLYIDEFHAMMTDASIVRNFYQMYRNNQEYINMMEKDLNFKFDWVINTAANGITFPQLVNREIIKILATGLNDHIRDFKLIKLNELGNVFDNDVVRNNDVLNNFRILLSQREVPCNIKHIFNVCLLIALEKKQIPHNIQLWNENEDSLLLRKVIYFVVNYRCPVVNNSDASIKKYVKDNMFSLNKYTNDLINHFTRLL
nr:hypothetical protein [uncultured Flavobacterium sp.]